MPASHKPLSYSHDALEPTIDAKTMEIHHGLHYKAYVDNFNKALEKAPQLAEKSVEEVLANNLSAVPEEIKMAVRNNGGGVVNHELFWELLTPGGSKTPTGNLGKAIESTFGSFDKLKEAMSNAGATRFGSGWSWLVKNNGKLEVYSTPNQDSPLMEGKTPIVGIDVWEHAYYLKYQNKRPAYLAAIWDVINWNVAEEKFNR